MCVCVCVCVVSVCVYVCLEKDIGISNLEVMVFLDLNGFEAIFGYFLGFFRPFTFSISF